MDVLEIIIFLVILWACFSFFSLAPWVPTKKKDLKRIHSIVNLKKSETFLEIWCGTSLVWLYIAKNNPESRVVWVELSPVLYLISRIKVFLSGCKNIEIRFANALKMDFSEFDVLYVFWLPETITHKLFPKISHIDKKNLELFPTVLKWIMKCLKKKNINKKILTEFTNIE